MMHTSLNAYSGGLLDHLQLHGGSNLAASGARNASADANGPTVSTLSSAINSSQSMHGCFSLKASKFCGGWYGDYSMSVMTTVGGYRVTNAEDFDTVMESYFGSQDEFDYINRFFGCQSWTGYPMPRYRISYTCRSLLESDEARICNAKNSMPPPLCAGTCKGYVNEWTALTANHSLCVNNALSEDRRKLLAKGCESWPYNGTSVCVSSVESGAEVCGFAIADGPSKLDGHSRDWQLCNFCKKSNESCCNRPYALLQCGKSMSKGTQLKGLSISLALVLTVACLAAVWFFYRWNYSRTARGASTAGGKRPKFPNNSSEQDSQYSNSLHTDRTTFHKSAISPQGSSVQANPDPAAKAVIWPLRIQKALRLFHRRRRSSGSGYVSTRSKHGSLVEQPLAETDQAPSSLLNLTIAKRGQSLRGCKGQLKPSPSETSSLAKSENESNDALEDQIDIDVTDGDMFTVLYPYTPVENDELAIAPGDKVRVLRTFSDGWTFVQRVDDSKIGAIPAVCLDTEP
ncbi:hypothetical protein BX667DRAFT_92349 [Coemansia mojavensis]|nr:hypothetical protein BX667DRAFT_92349 [Coemansia mojavensis]